MTTETIAPTRWDEARLKSNLLAGLIRDRAENLGDRNYLEDARGDRRLSFLALESAVHGWAKQFDESGLSRGVVVAIAIADPIAFSAAFLAIIASGRWVAPLDPGAPIVGAAGLATASARVQADVLIADRPFSREWGVPGIEIGNHASLVPGVPTAGSDVGRSHISASTSARPGAGNGGTVLSSSGTTGTPKLIPLSQGQLLHTAGSVAEHHRLSGTDRGFNPLPLFHINAEVVGLLASLVAGASLVLDDRFHRTNFWGKMSRHKVTWINAVPAIISRLADPDPDEIIPTEIRFIRSASAPLPAETMTRFELHTGIAVLETYGMTEAASQITANPLTGIRKPGSVGLPVGVQLRIVPDPRPTSDDAAGEVAETGGQVEIRGPSVITAYGGGLYQDRVDGEGWLKTGDLGHLDEDGYLYLDGRIDDVINRGGEKVFPREIEEAILADPDVLAVSVVGQPDPELGQVPVAFLVVRGMTDTSDAGTIRDVVARIGRHLDSALVRSKRPVALHVVSKLPVGATGKVQRRALRDQEVPVIYSVGRR
jgi:acyl-CoA synthetase (AMP-forming)/AMP-acid ligase II